MLIRIPTTTQELSAKKSLNLAVTKLIVATAEKEAAKNRLAMFITVIDDGGTVMMVERMDDAQIGSFDVSMGKVRRRLNSSGFQGV